MTLPSPLIGILGGMGPQAGIDMAEKLIALTRTECDQEHLPFVLFSVPESVPDRTGFLLGKTPENPAYAIADQLEMMAKMGVSIAVMACNTAHARPIFDIVRDRLEDSGVELRILHLIRETITHIKDQYPGVKKVGVLATKGTYQSRLYDQAIEEAGLEVVIPDRKIREDHIHAALYAPSFGIKSTGGTVTAEASRRIHEAIQHLQDRGAEAIILGCTELPLAVKETQIDQTPILDPATIVVKKLIREIRPGRLLVKD